MGKRKYYYYLIFVIIVWGAFPNITAFFYNYMSASVYSSLTAVITAISFTIFGWKKRHLLTRKSIKIPLVTGVFYSAAILVQMIGLQYTTPSIFAFLENSCCIVVPILLFMLLGKKQHPLVWFASVLCLTGCFVLSGASFDAPVGIGELLCGLAGVFYAVNIVGTGEFARDIPVTVYLMVQKWVFAITSLITMVVLHVIAPGGIPLEPMIFHWIPGLLILKVVCSLVSGTLCWMLRTEVTQNIDVTLVSVMMPLSAVITMAISVLQGTDVLTINLVVGAGMILLATILSALGSVAGQRTLQT